MKIHSKFKDYYDSVRAVFHGDVEPIYTRVTTEVDLRVRWPSSQEEQERAAPFRPLLNLVPPTAPDGQVGVIGFCGKAYPFWFMRSWERTTLRCAYGYRGVLQLMLDSGNEYTRDNAKKLLRANEILKQDMDEIERHKALRRLRANWSFNEKTIEDWFKANRHRFALGDAMFRYFRAPVVAVVQDGNHDMKGIVNPRLSDYDFASQVSPFDAFQELSMFVSNNLAFQDDPSSRMTDIDKRDAHGFDNKSFKKEPTKNRAFKRRGH